MLETLSEVQSLDLDGDQVAAQRSEVPAELIALRANVRDLRHEHARVKTEHDALRKRVAANELELKTLQQRRKDASEAALRAESSKEASQFQNQELMFSNRAQELEEDTLPLMEELDRWQAEADRLSGELETLTPDLAAMEEAEQERLAGIEAKLADLADRRGRLAATVEAPLLKQYEQVRKARRGLALVAIKDNKRCGGCQVQLPIHVVQKVLKGQGITRCPSCGRILHA